MRCVDCLENEARYVDERGLLTCGICPLKRGRRSWRISDVPGIIEELTARILGRDELIKRLDYERGLEY